MQPNKVRIGNIFKEEYTEKLIKVIEIRQKSITFSEKFRGKWKANPIELTEDILLKCGFVNYEIFKNTWAYNGIELYILNGIISFELMNNSLEIKYLDQLQNLYFALTGKELEVNLN